MVILSPVGIASFAANRISALVTIKENLCKAFHVNPSSQPQTTVNYTTGTPTLEGGTVFVPVTATVNVVTPAGCKASTQLFTETFFLAFQGQTAIPTAVTFTVNGSKVLPTNIQCCKAKSIAIFDSIIVTITPPS